MQRVILLLINLFALYACSSVPPSAQPAAPATIATPSPIEVPLVPAEPVITQAIETEPPLVIEPILMNPDAQPHLALLLPLEDKNYGDAARAVRDGFMAAASLNPDSLPVRFYNKTEDNSNVVAAYRNAVSSGAVAVIGPLTRDGVASLALEKNFPVPTLALNNADVPTADQLYFFGLSADDEARTVATLAANMGYHHATVISNGSPISKRLQLAFEETWSSLGLSIDREIDFNGDSSVFKGLFTRHNPDFKPKTETDPGDPMIPEYLVVPDTMVFMATGVDTARKVRPYLPNKLPTFATSQVFPGNDENLINYDLNGIRFVDMPWLLQPDHPAVLAYPHSNTPLTAVQERLYALGIDSYRLVQLMLKHNLQNNLPMNGVVGKIELKGHTLQRTAVAGVFTQGHAVSTETVIEPAIQMFPDQYKPKP